MSRSEAGRADRRPGGKLPSALSAIVDAVRPGSEAASAESSEPPSDSARDSLSGAEAGGAGDAVAGTSSDGAGPRAEMPEETLFRLLRDNGGRIKQSALVEETSWSPARVSRRLKNLEAAGWVCRVRQGRENVVFVPPSE